MIAKYIFNNFVPKVASIAIRKLEAMLYILMGPFIRRQMRDTKVEIRKNIFKLYISIISSIIIV